jgi:hypothetical protein
MSDYPDPSAPESDPRLRVLYGPSPRKLKAGDQLHADGYRFRRARSRADLLVDLVGWSPHILMLEWEQEGMQPDGQGSATQRLLEFVRGYLGIRVVPVLLCGHGLRGVPEVLRPCGVRNYVDVGASQAIRETLVAMSAARANPTLWNMLFREAA